MLAVKVAVTCANFVVYSGSFCLVLKLVVHHAPVAMCPFSFGVVSRCISASLLKVIVQFDLSVSPTACGFQWIRFCSGLTATSPSMLIVSVAEAVWFC